jgi:hypothetical protein
MLKMGIQQGRSDGPTAGVALGYVEDGDKPRTQLGSIFSILMT